MNFEDYRSTINTKISDTDAFRKIARVAEWWNRCATGKAEQVGDRFKVNFGQTWVEFEVVEAVPNKRVVWLVTDCYLHFVEAKTEWKHTKVAWDLETANGTTKITMTHEDLTPATECFKHCEAGWNF